MEETDWMMEGFQFGNYDKDKTPYDFITNRETGIRPGQPTTGSTHMKPSGFSKVDLRDGVKPYHVIPPVAIWENGKYFFELEEETQKTMKAVYTDEEWDTWIVSGEGTPGNFVLRGYVLPDKISHYELPDHPMDWEDEIREKGNDKPTYNHYGTGGFGFGHGGMYAGQQHTVTKALEPPKPPPLPVGIRFRCRGCGHWFKESDFAGHSTHCCAAQNGPEGSDWAILCECCLSLDEVSKCKDGFPLDKKEDESTPSDGKMTGNGAQVTDSRE